MTARATILKIASNRATVRYGEAGECGSCQACSKAFARKETILEVAHRGDLDLKEGDTVEIFLSPWKGIRAGFQVLIFPLLLFLGFYFLGEKALGAANETISILLGLFGIALGFLLNLLYKMIRKNPDLPEIVRVLEYE